MANTRCFDSLKPNLTAGELSDGKRKKTIFNEIRRNVQYFNTANPVKSNGKEYNSNTQVNTTCDISFGALEFAESYAVMDDVREGAALCIPVQISTPINTVNYDTCSNICSNTFANGFQDIGGNGSGTIQVVSISGVDTTTQHELRVYDMSANMALQHLDTNANLDAYTEVITPLIYPAGGATTSFTLGTGPNRYRNATVLGSCDSTTNINPMFVFQFSADGTNWFGDGTEPAFFTISINNWQFCLQRSNVPTQYVRLFCVNSTTFNYLQIVLTKH
jgi:hypothetical protein